ncbi:MAG: hypothetical protein HY050_03135 [Actinobacteria bacterium]|nr:hypothetical protein [Actinomycetota bacterium]
MMDVSEFSKKYGIASQSIDKIVDQWILEKRVSDFLGTEIFAGVMISDLMMGDQLVDTVPPDVKDAFFNLMGDQADTRSEIETMILEKAHVSRESVIGLMNKIQGQLGEDTFKKTVGASAELATSGSQEGWDVAVHHHDFTQYVQVKVYQDANQAVEALKELQDKVDSGVIHDGSHVVHAIDFAVNSDIYADVSKKATELGLSAKVLDLGATHGQLRDQLTQAVDHVANAPLQHFFGELLQGVVASAALQTAANAFLVYKGAKDRAMAAEDTTYSTLVSAGGLSVAHITDQFLCHALMFAGLEKAAAFLSGPPGAVVVLGVGIGARGLLRRIADRRHVARRFAAGNIELQQLVERVASI